MSHTLTLLAGAAALSMALAAGPAVSADAIKNVVLVHGAWADGTGWKPVYDILVKDGFNVSIVQNPLTSLADDVAAVDRVLARQDGPVILVGHSYGGTVITEAGDDPKVAGLVYVEAFAPRRRRIDLRPPAQGCAAAADRAVGRRLRLLQQGRLCRRLRRQRRSRDCEVHGGLAGADRDRRSRQRRRLPSRRGRPSRAGTRSAPPTTSSRRTPSG